MTAEITLKDQIREVGRELGMRKSVYPRWVRDGRMTQEEANRRVAVIDAVYATLKKLEQTNGSG